MLANASGDGNLTRTAPILSNTHHVGGSRPSARASVTRASALTGHTAHKGWCPSDVSAIAAPLPAAAINRGNRLSGSSGTSQGLTAKVLAPISRAHANPTLTPASGPAASP